MDPGGTGQFRLAKMSAYLIPLAVTSQEVKLLTLCPAVGGGAE
jgi:hypothetical protein